MKAIVYTKDEPSAEARRYVDQEHKKGNVVITVEHNNKTQGETK